MLADKRLVEAKGDSQCALVLAPIPGPMSRLFLLVVWSAPTALVTEEKIQASGAGGREFGLLCFHWLSSWT